MATTVAGVLPAANTACANATATDATTTDATTANTASVVIVIVSYVTPPLHVSNVQVRITCTFLTQSLTIITLDCKHRIFSSVFVIPILEC